LLAMEDFGAKATPELRKKEATLRSRIEKQHSRARR
jgi:hypothetical protein